MIPKIDEKRGAEAQRTRLTNVTTWISCIGGLLSSKADGLIVAMGDCPGHLEGHSWRLHCVTASNDCMAVVPYPMGWRDVWRRH